MVLFVAGELFILEENTTKLIPTPSRNPRDKVGSWLTPVVTPNVIGISGVQILIKSWFLFRVFFQGSKKNNTHKNLLNVLNDFGCSSINSRNIPQSHLTRCFCWSKFHKIYSPKGWWPVVWLAACNCHPSILWHSNDSFTCLKWLVGFLNTQRYDCCRFNQATDKSAKLNTIRKDAWEPWSMGQGRMRTFDSMNEILDP